MLAANTTRLSSVPLDDFEIADDGYVLVPEGRYTLSLIGWFTGKFFARQPKVALIFKIVDQGEYFGAEVRRWYNIQRCIGKPGKNGRFKVVRGSDLLADFIRLVGLTTRRDRLALSKLQSVAITADVETVVRNRKQGEIPTPLRYSVVRSLRGIAAGSVEGAKSSSLDPRPTT